MSFFKPQVSFHLILHQPSVSWHIISLKFSSWNIICFLQKIHQSTVFRLLSAVMKVHPFPHVIFETIRSGFVQILHHCLLLETQSISGEVYFTCAGGHTCAKASRSVINCKLKSNFWLYIFTASLPVFDHQDMCLLSCYYNTDGCHWLLNRCFVNECFDSEIRPIYKHFKVICAYRAPN